MTEHVRFSADEQLIDQARALHAKAMNCSDLASEGAWVAHETVNGLPPNNYWAVTATRTPTAKGVDPFTEWKAHVKTPAMAGLLTFISTALPQLCDLAERALAAAPASPEGAELGLKSANDSSPSLPDSLSGGEGWRGIESAPRDGTKIDIWVPKRGRLADRYWSKPGSITEGGWGHREIRNRRSVGMIEHEVRPTHWMPLPPPPSGEGGS